MKDIFRLLIIALIGYGLYSYFMTREEAEISPGDLALDSPARCLERLDRAGEGLGSAIRRFQAPPIDQEAWEEEYASLESLLDIAEAACNCAGDACHRAKEAHRQLRSLVLDYHDGFTSGTGPPFDAPARIDEFQNSLEAARALDL